MSDNLDLAETLLAVAREINSPGDLPATLDAIVRAATTSLPGVDHAGISMLHRRGTIETVAGTDQLVWDLDSVQYELREGPCYDAVKHEPVMIVNELQHDQRWPRYVPHAAARGVQVGLCPPQPVRVANADRFDHNEAAFSRGGARTSQRKCPDELFTPPPRRPSPYRRPHPGQR